MAQQPKTQSLTLERTFDAPREQVWRAFTDPKLYAQWINPMPGGRADVHELDARKGGKVRFDLVFPNGMRQAEGGVFEVVDPPRELVMYQANDERQDAFAGFPMRLRTVLTAQGDKTHLRLEVTGLPPGFPLDMAEGGFRTCLDLLEGVVAADRTIALSRVFEAPRDKVWAAFTERDQVAQWWGPEGFRTTTRRMEVTPGGRWEFTMHGPDGTDYPNWVQYEEVSKPHKLRYAHGGGKPGDDKPHFHVLVTFEDLQGRTRVTMRSIFPTREAKDHVVREYHAIEGGKQTLARLAEHLVPSPPAGKARVTAPPGTREIHIVRVFDAPRSKVWRAMTEPQLLAQWWGRGNKLVVETFEFRRGGHWRFVEHGEGGAHGFEGRFADIQPIELVAMTFEWDGMPGHVALQRMALEELPGGKTKLVATSLFMAQEDRDGMLAYGMEEGMNQSYAALDQVLAGLEA